MKKTIRMKIMLVVFIPVITAFLISGLGASQYFYNILEEHTVTGEDQKLEQTARQLQYIQNNVINIAKQIVVDDKVQTLLREEKHFDILEKLIAQKDVKKTLRSYINQQSYLYGVTIVAPDYESFSSNSTEGQFIQSKETWYKNFKATGAYKGFSEPHIYTLEQGLQKREVVSYIMSFKDIRNGKDILGDVILHMGISEIEKYAILDATLLQGYSLYDSAGNVIIKNGSLSLSFESMSSKKATKEHLKNGNTLLMNYNFENGWMMVSEVSNTLLLNQLKYIKFFFITIFLAAISILAIVLYLAIRNITKPVSSLHKAAIQVGNGNMDVSVNIKTNDELAVLGDAFNGMVTDIRRRMEETIAYEKTTREMEINRLMLQINPHFIYNTLNSIVYMAQIEGNKDIVHFSNAFITLLQDTLRFQKDSIFISMEQELKNIKNYLTLQSYRYPDRFDIRYDIDESLCRAMVPNILIQPIVENAIFHGLAGKAGKGQLEIVIHKKEKDIEIIVKDDGLGMSSEVVTHLLNDEDAIQGEMRTIGVGNVKKRIAHIYGGQYGIQIESVPGKGTEVNIRIPIQDM